MTLEIKILQSGDARLLGLSAPGLFDKEIDPALTAQFLADPRHHLVVAIDASHVVGFVSAVDYIHPDKPRELWINEVAVAPTHQGQGIGKRLLGELLDVARGIGCHEAWVLTDRDNSLAMRLYASAGAQLSREQVMFTFKLD
jgi:aminoglycoside 6'-N-acetyltransferase I